MMLIADILNDASRRSVPAANAAFNSGPWSTHTRDIISLNSELKNRSIYAFERSALNAAADIRVDSPERAESLMQAVLLNDARYFIEAEAKDWLDILSTMRGSFSLGQKEFAQARQFRWGAFITIENGLMQFRTISCAKENVVKKSGDPIFNSPRYRDLPSGVLDTVRFCERVVLSSDECTLDLNRRTGLSRPEFAEAAEVIMDGADPVITSLKTSLRDAAGARAKQALLDSAWRLVRMRDVTLTRQDAPRGDARYAEALHRAFAHDHFRSREHGLALITMLAVLMADGSDIRKTPRRMFRSTRSGAPGNSDTSRRSAGSASRDISVVTLNLGSTDLQKMYEGRLPSGDASAADTAGRGRVRHAVRGHLFLARNGRLVYRSPHFRGSLEKTHVRRVVAPGHADK